MRAISIEGDASAATIALIRAAIEQAAGRVDLSVRADPLAPGQALAVSPASNPLTDVIAVVAHETGLTAVAIASIRRDAALVRARDAVVWAAAELLGLSNSHIGRRLADRDPATILVSRRRALRRQENEPAFRSLCDRLDSRFAQEAR